MYTYKTKISLQKQVIKKEYEQNKIQDLSENDIMNKKEFLHYVNKIFLLVWCV